MNYKPLAGNILVELFAPRKKVGEILLAEVTQSVEQLRYAKVVAIGQSPTSRTGIKIPMEVQLGDVILIGDIQNCAHVKDPENKDRRLLMFKEDSIAAIVDDYVDPNAETEVSEEDND